MKLAEVCDLTYMDIVRADMLTTKDIATKNGILRGEVGSSAHGMAIAGTDDIDQMGVFIEPPEYVCGLSSCDHYVYRDAKEGERSKPGDLDLTLYSLRKFCRLAAAGNPSVIVLLWLPHYEFETSLGSELISKRKLFISKESGKRFLGYLTAQKKSLTGERVQKVNRPELIEKYGFDCYSSDTEFLTETGWKLYDEIDNITPVATINKQSREIEFQIPTERISKLYTGPMIAIRHRYSDCLVTPNHRMFVSPVYRGACGVLGNGYRSEDSDWGFSAAKNLNKGFYHFQISAPQDKPEYDIDDADLALVGAFISEGSIAKKRSNGDVSVLSFTQKVGGRLEGALDLINSKYPLKRYEYTRFDREKGHGPYAIYTLANREVSKKISQECGETCLVKNLPPWVYKLSKRQAMILLSSLMDGDGTRYTHREPFMVYYTSSRQLAGDVQALALTIGYRSNMWGPYPNGMYQVFMRGGDMYQAVSAKVNIKNLESYSGKIVCFTVPNEILVTRRNGRVAMHGNTKFASHALRLGIQGIQLLREERLSLPIDEPWLGILRAIKEGKVTYKAVIDMIESAESELKYLIDKCNLVADKERINKWLVEAHRIHWGMSYNI